MSLYPILPSWVPAISAAVVTAVIAYGAHSLDVNRIEAKQRTALATQAAALQAECKADKAITTKVEDDYEDKLTALNGQLADAMRVQPTACVRVSAASPARGRHAAAGSSQPAHADAIPARALFALAGEGERYRIQVIALQNFIKLTWTAKNQ